MRQSDSLTLKSARTGYRLLPSTHPTTFLPELPHLEHVSGSKQQRPLRPCRSGSRGFNERACASHLISDRSSGRCPDERHAAVPFHGCSRSALSCVVHGAAFARYGASPSGRIFCQGDRTGSAAWQRCRPSAGEVVDYVLFTQDPLPCVKRWTCHAGNFLRTTLHTRVSHADGYTRAFPHEHSTTWMATGTRR